MRGTGRFSTCLLAALLSLGACGDDGESSLVGRQISVAVENAAPPFNDIDPLTGEGVGWDYDAVREICGRLGCVPEFVQVTFDGALEALRSGQFDILADGVTRTAERERIVDFSIPYAGAFDVLVTRPGELPYEQFSADPGKLVGVQSGTVSEDLARELFVAERIRTFPDVEAAAGALLAAEVDGVILDNITTAGFLAANPGRLEVLAQLDEAEPLAFAFREGSELRGPVNAALRAMMSDGTLERLNRKWGLS
jgi:polar amino acid transport system substrate-binding protein